MPPITWTRSPAAVPANYAAYLLGDDVLAVIDSLKVNRPVLVGQSIGDEELSSGRRLFVRLPGRGTPDLKPLVQELLQTILPQFEKDLQEMQKDLQAMPVPPLPAPVRGSNSRSGHHRRRTEVYGYPGHPLSPFSRFPIMRDRLVTTTPSRVRRLKPVTWSGLARK